MKILLKTTTDKIERKIPTQLIGFSCSLKIRKAMSIERLIILTLLMPKTIELSSPELFNAKIIKYIEPKLAVPSRIPLNIVLR